MYADVKVVKEVEIYTDSVSAKAVANRRGLGRNRHLDTRVLWVQQRIRNKEIQVFKMSKRKKKIQSLRNINEEHTRLKIKRRIKKLRIQINTFSKIPTGLPGAGHTPWTFLDEIVFH